MQAGHYSSLLPELFRHKTTKVRLFQPQVMLIDFHGTISERRWEDRVIFPYVRRALGKYLRDNLNSEPIQRCLAGLRNESFEQRFRNRYEDAPVIEEQSETDNNSLGEPTQLLAQQLEEFVHWQMASRRETRETQIIERLVWQDGFRQRQLATPIYEDALPCIQDWHDRLHLSMYIISSIDSETLKLLFENTDRGNLHQYLSGYVSSKRIGDKLISDTYKQFYERTVSKECQQRLLLASSKSAPAGSKAKAASVSAAAAAAASASTNSSPLNAAANSQANGGSGGRSPAPPAPSSPSANSDSNKSGGNRSTSSTGLKSPRSSTSSIGSSSSELIYPKPILFLTDSGQEAKAASLVADGAAFECLLVNRPGNKRIRTYYLSQFQYVDKFDDIEFIQQ